MTTINLTERKARHAAARAARAANRVPTGRISDEVMVAALGKVSPDLVRMFNKLARNV